MKRGKKNGNCSFISIFMTERIISELMKMFKDQDDAWNALYKLNTFNEEEINKIYSKIKDSLIETKASSPIQTIMIIERVLPYNIKYFKSYKAIFKKIYDEYHPKLYQIHIEVLPYILWSDISDEDGILLSEKFNDEIIKQKTKKYSLDFLEDNTIYKVIMDDNIESFIFFTEREGFDAKLVSVRI